MAPAGGKRVNGAAVPVEEELLSLAHLCPAIERCAKMEAVQGGSLVMDIGRQPDASRYQRGIHDESQPVHDHAVPVIVFAAALVLGEAQDRRNVRGMIIDGVTRPVRPVHFSASRPNAGDTMVVIARLQRNKH
jgi:hypothetical protein